MYIEIQPKLSTTGTGIATIEYSQKETLEKPVFKKLIDYLNHKT